MEQSKKSNEPELAWQTCHYCSLEHFKSQQEFTRHLRDRHCTKEGGSYVCRYGYNGVCNSLPLDGVSDRDYESHVQRHHVSKMSSIEQWSVYSAAQNLSAVLNDPGRGKQSNFFTKTWGDSFIEKIDVSQSIYLPEINVNHFENYLRKVGKRYRKHTRLSQSSLETFNSKLTSRLRTNVPSREDDLSVIPNIFLQPTLPLNDATTFNTVFPCVGNESSSDHRSGRLLQEKLSHYLDIVEVQIAQQVAQKSSTFFHAMTSHDTIMEQMSTATEEVRNLRGKVQLLNQNLAKSPLRLLALARSRANHASLITKLHLMATVLQTKPQIQALLSTPDYVGAIELIAGTQEVLNKDLAGVTSLRYLPSELNELCKLIDKMLSEEFERYAALDLHRPLKSDSKVLEPERLVSLVAGLLRQNHIQFLDIYKQEAVMAAQAVLKQLLIEHLANAEGDIEMRLTGTGETTPNMNSSQWLQLIKLTTDAFSKLVFRVKAVHDVIQDTCNASAGHLSGSEIDMTDTDKFLSSEDHQRVELKLKDLLISVCDYCNERCAGLVSSQSEKMSISPEQIVELLDTVEEFTELCEKICGKESLSLKSAFKNQASKFVQRFHTQKKSKLALLLDNEHWKSTDVHSEFQSLLDKIANGDIIADSSPTENSPEGTSASTLQVGKNQFVSVGAVLMLIRFVHEYCVCSKQLPIMAVLIGKNLAELLSVFNSRTCQLVLGAKALETAGLNRITTTNLALASRALQLVLWLIPHIKSHFATLGIESFPTLDLVEKNIMHHIQQLEAKILFLMNSLIATQLNEWTARPPIPSHPFRAICKHLDKLYEAIGNVLPPEQVTAIYSTIHISFKDHLRAQLVKMNIVNNGGPQHGAVTSELTFYLETLRTLKVLPLKDLSDKALDNIWVK